MFVQLFVCFFVYFCVFVCLFYLNSLSNNFVCLLCDGFILNFVCFAFLALGCCFCTSLFTFVLFCLHFLHLFWLFLKSVLFYCRQILLYSSPSPMQRQIRFICGRLIPGVLNYIFWHAMMGQKLQQFPRGKNKHCFPICLYVTKGQLKGLLILHMIFFLFFFFSFFFFFFWGRFGAFVFAVVIPVIQPSLFLNHIWSLN